MLIEGATVIIGASPLRCQYEFGLLVSGQSMQNQPPGIMTLK
jgi:hypothetical protein